MANITFINNRAILHKKEEHLFRLYDGFGISNDDMCRIIGNRCAEIMIIVKNNDDSETVYISSVDNWTANAISHDNSGEKQTVLKRSMFEKILGDKK